MKISIIGADHNAMIDALHRSDLFEIVGIYDKDIRKATTAADEYSVRAFDEISALTGEVAFDCVFINGTGDEKESHILAFLGLKKNTLCFAPGLTSPQCFKAAQECCINNRTVFLQIPKEAFFRGRMDVMNNQKSGKLGRPAVANVSYYSKKEGGWHDLYFDLLYNEMCWLYDIFGEADNIYAMSNDKCSKSYTQVTIGYQSGALSIVDLMFNYPGETVRKAEICGSEGVIKYDYQKYTPYKVVKKQSSLPMDLSDLSIQYDQNDEILSSFRKNILDQDFLPQFSRKSYKITQWAQAAQESAETNRAVFMNYTE
jgi:predicted dehydrogenase